MNPHPAVVARAKALEELRSVVDRWYKVLMGPAEAIDAVGKALARCHQHAAPPIEPAGKGQLSVDDWVTWTSQAQGSETTKVGQIVLVVPPETFPSQATGFAALRPTTASKILLGKSHSKRPCESYIVRVRAGTYYWPLAQKLIKIKAPKP